MKKGISFILTFAILLSMSVFTVSAETQVSINATDVMPGGQGVGFFDNTVGSEATEPESDGNNGIILRANEWVKYDISALNLEAGSYILTVRQANISATNNAVFFDAFVDDTLYQKAELFSTGGFTSFSDTVIGNVFIGEGARTITLRNSNLYDNKYVCVESFTLDYEDGQLPDITLTWRSQNVISHIMNEGYYDAEGALYTSGKISSVGASVMHPTDWGKYDITGLKRGTYKMYVYIGNTANSIISVNAGGKKPFGDAPIAASGNYMTYDETLLGQLWISGEEDYLTINCVSSSLFLHSFKLVFESDENLTLSTYARIEAENPITGGQGEAYYDNQEVASHVGNMEISSGATGKSVCYRKNEWVKYDISMLRAGRYRMEVSSASIVSINLQVSVDDNVSIKEYPVPIQGSYTLYETNKVGYLHLDGTQQTMTVKHSGGGVASYIDYFELTCVVDIEYVGMQTNTFVTDSFIPRGTDTFSLAFNTRLTLESLTDKAVKIIDSKGTPISKQISLSEDEHSIVLTLLETLDYEEEYEIVINGIMDNDGQSINKEVRIPFYTSGDVDDEGFASFSNIVQKKEGDKITISGAMLSSAGLPIEGRIATLLITAPSGEISANKQAFSDGNGKFTLSHTFAQDGEEGKYTLKISGEYVDAQNSVTRNTAFVNTVTEKLICSAISLKSSVDEIKASFEQYSAIMGIDLETVSGMIDLNNIYLLFTNKSFSSADNIIEEFDRGIALELINQAVLPDQIRLVMNNEYDRELLSFNYDFYTLLNENNKTKVIGDILSEDRFLTPNDCTAAVNGIINEAVRIQFGIEIPAFSVNDASITEGEGAIFLLEFTSDQTQVSGIDIIASYTNDTVFGQEAEYSTSARNAKIETENINNGIFIHIDASAVEFGAFNEICTLGFSTFKGMEGSYALSIDGTVTYKLATEPVRYLTVDFQTDNTAKLAITANSDKKSRPSDLGGAPKAAAYGSVPIITEDASKEQKKEENTLRMTDRGLRLYMNC